MAIDEKTVANDYSIVDNQLVYHSGIVALPFINKESTAESQLQLGADRKAVGRAGPVRSPYVFGAAIGR